MLQNCQHSPHKYILLKARSQYKLIFTPRADCLSRTPSHSSGATIRTPQFFSPTSTERSPLTKWHLVDCHLRRCSDHTRHKSTTTIPSQVCPCLTCISQGLTSTRQGKHFRSTRYHKIYREYILPAKSRAGHGTRRDTTRCAGVPSREGSAHPCFSWGTEVCKFGCCVRRGR